MSEFTERKFGDLVVKIDRQTCISTANCRVVAPELFVLDDEEICAFAEDAPVLERERLIEACQVCPVDALVLVDADGKQIVPEY